MADQATKMTATPLDFSEPEKQQKIAALAYQFWLARAFHRGSPARDWLRAEREVRGHTGAAQLRRTTLGDFLVAI